MTTDLAEWLAAQDIPALCKTRLRQLHNYLEIKTLEQLCTRSYMDLKHDNLGHRSLAHLERCLAAEGRYLRGSEPVTPDAPRQLIADLWHFIERDNAMNGEFTELRDRVQSVMRKREP